MDEKFVNGHALSRSWSKIKEWVEKRIDEKIDERMKGNNQPTQQKGQDEMTCWERWWGDDKKGGVE